MGHARKMHPILLGGLLTVTGCYGAGTFCGPDVSLPPMDPAVLAPPTAPAPPNPAVAAELPAVPASQPAERPLPINLLNALQLANVRSVDIEAAADSIRVAAALLEGAQVLWLPTITLGGDYNRHDGRIQDSTGNIADNSHSSGMLGLGTGIGPAAILDVGQAIYAPLYARQQMRSRQADLQATSNNTLVAVTDAYFTVQQARGQLAGVTEAIRLNEDLLARTRKLAPAIVPDLELFRAETELAHLRDSELLYREQWKVASAQLLQVLRLDPAAQVEPVEPPQLDIKLIDLKKPVDDLIPIGLTYRPELASQQALVQATLTLLRQERLRPLIPSVLFRGFSTPVTGTLGAGYFGGGTNSSFGDGGLRSDFDLQVLWQLNNLGFGNRALVHQREAENRLAIVQLFRIQDLVASEVAQAYAQAQMAARRVEVTEKGLRSAVLSVNKNLDALSQTKGIGNQLVTLVRPQEVVAALQALLQAYIDYYTAVADANRAQFRLYRALGQPAQYLAQDDKAPKLCVPPPSVPPADETLPTPRTPPAESGGAGDSGPPK
jgi:outer membrane protein TolC